MSGAEQDRERQAEVLYASLVDRTGIVSDEALEDLCVRHAPLESQLRSVHERWRGAASIYRNLNRHVSVADSLAALGRDVGPGLELEGEAPVTGARRMIRRLEAYAPKSARYEVRGELARGGMGAILHVYDADLRRNLAMKVVLSEDGSEEAAVDTVGDVPLGRFLEEAQITGQLDHPGIVPVHELGVDEGGRVFFTMRLVKGRELKTIIEQAHRGEDGWTQTRVLRVILKIAETMAYAHYKGVIHRDLKPANVMVGRHGEVYVMDWGLARVRGRRDSRNVRVKKLADSAQSIIHTERDEDKGALETMDGHVLGTPAYMSPEQAIGDVEGIDERSDVFSLGAILYHALAGHAPYEVPGREMNGYAVWGLVQAGEPDPLANRASDAPGELVAICEKAMHRDPARRYATMGEFGDDLAAFLDGRVVHAFETGALAEFRKWVRRNRATAAASATALLLALFGLASTSFVQARANDELGEKNAALELATERFRTARDEADHVVEFLSGLFASQDPEYARGETVTAKELLDRGAASIAAANDISPVVAARMMDVMGSAYDSLGLYDEASPLLEGALEVRASTLGPDAPETLASRGSLGWHELLVGRYDEAERLLDAALVAQRESFGDEDERTLETRGRLATLRAKQGRFEEAERLHRELLDEKRRALGAGHAATLTTENDLGQILSELGRYDEAEEHLQSSYQARKTLLGEDHPDTLHSLHRLASVLSREGRSTEALAIYEDVLAARIRVLGDDHPRTLATLNDVAYQHFIAGRLAQAQPLYERALAGFRRVLGDDHPDTLTILNNLGSLYHSLGRWNDAEALLNEAFEVSLRVRGEDHPHTLGAMNSLAFHYFQRGRLDDAEPLFTEALERLREVLGEAHPNTLILMQSLATLYREQGRLEEAEELARDLLLLTERDDANRASRRALLESIQAELDGR